MRIPAGLLAISLLASVWTAQRLPAPAAPMQFQTGEELRRFADASGLQTHADGMNLRISFFISDHPLASDDLLAVPTRLDCGLTPSWRGILWVSQIRTSQLVICPEHIGGKYRVWGNVVVAGDEEIMDRLEQCFRERNSGEE